MIRTPGLAAVKKMAAEPGSNLVVLPTAAPRQVRQTYNRQYREAKAAMRPWPGEHLHPGEREALRKARIIFEMNQTPELLIATAIYGVLSPENRKKVEARLLASAALTDGSAHVQAATAITAMGGTYGQQNDMLRAIERLKAERDQ